MRYRPASEHRDVLWARYWAIREERGRGFQNPILRHLAFGGDVSAMTELADTFPKKGRMANPFSRAGLYYRAHRGGYAYAAQHLAMDAFNRNDLASYRHWLRRAAWFDPHYLRQLRRFETRLPHETAKAIGRKRPWRDYD